MTDVDLKSINGLGNVSLDEIDLYRSRFSPPPLSAEDRIKIAVIRRKFYPAEGTAVLAAKTGISKNAARAVDLVVREAVPEVVEAVEQGNVPLREARIIRYLPPETQKEYVRAEVKPPAREVLHKYLTDKAGGGAMHQRKKTLARSGTPTIRG
jgi:hypothetical protein